MVSVSALEREVLVRAANVHAAHAALAESLTEFERSEQWQGAGIRSIGHWADIHLGIDSQRAGRVAAAGARLGELPALLAAFAEGAVSLDKVLVVAPVATAASDAMFTAMARQASVAQLGRICAAYREVTKPDDAAAAEERRVRRSVTSASTEYGLVRIVALLEPDEAAIVLAALDARAEAAWRGDGASGAASSLTERRADALVEVATEGLVAGPDPVVRGERVEVRVHVDAELLAGVRPDGRCEIEGVGAVARSTVQRLLCDCRFQLTADGPFGTLNVGRAQRTVNRRQRRALQFRDRGCRFPGCQMRRFVDAHHVVPWEAGGGTDLDNLMLLCPAHHRLFHEGDYSIDALGDGAFRFRRPDGRSLHPPPLRTRPDAAVAAAGSPEAQGGGERFDLALTIDALVS